MSAQLFIRPKNLITIYMPKNRDKINLIFMEPSCSQQALYVQKTLIEKQNCFPYDAEGKQNTKWYK